MPNGDVLSNFFTCPAADFGYTLDILYLDNSFNMIVNGTKISSNELQFQSGITPSINTKFADNSYHGSTGVSSIYNINNYPTSLTTDKQKSDYKRDTLTTVPAVRIVISPAGKVSLFAIKNTGGAIYPLILSSGTLQDVTWNSNSSNNISIEQVVYGATAIDIRGYGRQIIK